MDYTEALSWLYGVQQFGIKPGLDNTRKLLKALQLPGSGQQFLHVAGTNGKGSTCAFMDGILRCGGQRTGLFTSPHLIQFRERIRLGGQMIPEDEVAQSLSALRCLVADWQPHPTFFELTLALALDWFDRAGAEYVVLETGMGGRLDSTNAVKPVVTVITPVAMDHQQWLGDTLGKIAAEKAGIIKPGIPVISAPQEPEAEEILRSAAAAAGAPLQFVQQPWTASPLPLCGGHQQWNAATAVAAIGASGCLLAPGAIPEGLAQTVWPARFQRLSGGKLVIDGAHNPHSIARLITTWQEQYGLAPTGVIFGAVEGKDHRQSLSLLSRITRRITFVTVHSPRAIPAAGLAREWTEVVPGIPCQTSDNLQELLQEWGLNQSAGMAPQAATSHPPAPHPDAPPVLLCGSLYLCGEVLAIFRNGDFESSSQ